MSNRDIIASHYAAGAAGNPEGMIEHFADHIHWTEAAGFPLAGTYIGKADVMENVFGPIADEWDGFGMHAETLIVEGDRVVAIGHYRGTHRITNNKLDARAVHIWTLTDGKITAFEQVTDTLIVDRVRTGMDA